MSEREILGVKKDVLVRGIVITAVIIVVSGFLYVLPSENSTGHAFRDSFLAGLQTVNPEFSLQDTTEEQPAPDSLHVPILIYHSVRPHSLIEGTLLRRYTVDPKIFETQLKYLKDQGYTVISLDTLDKALAGSTTLPARPVVLTFDDGWENQYVNAFPLLKKYGDTATFYIYTSAIGHVGFLTWDQVKELDQAGMTIGGHTQTHPYLVTIKDPAVLEREIAGGKKIIEAHLGKQLTLFAYPFGHYNDKLIDVIKKAGYVSARSAYKGTHHTISDIYKLKGVEVTDDMEKFIDMLNK